MNNRKFFTLLILLALCASFVFYETAAQKKNAQSRDSIAGSGWPAYGRDAGGSRYSPLAQINRANIKSLKVAWTYRTGAADVKAASARSAAFEATPILVDGALYFTTPYNRVIALDPAAGNEKSVDHEIG